MFARRQKGGEGGPFRSLQGWAWAHLRRVGGAPLSKVPDSGSAEGAGALGAVRRAGVFGPPLPTPGRGDSRGGTARERARTQLAPKIPNRPRGPAQERLLPPHRLPDAAYQRHLACWGSALTSLRARRRRRAAGPALSSRRREVSSAPTRGGGGWLRGAAWRLRRQAGSEVALGFLLPGSRVASRPPDLRAGTHGPRWVGWLSFCVYEENGHFFAPEV